ncbi:MAG: glucosamine-6-phosphate deaminase [Bacteroidetes bacterium]|jgi:glucosamine-6-phosphate deaminase|nr:glucosamine-6-phosphate deaminase [Bacteroidota bacterium]MAC06736.1 glucosamine-6-phosphate deaminase [Balneola sp.]MAO76932.1 glucosamine-6-phosphate deaminase [Balneola sp.]MBF64499.1 glucosamine-6-phosphate deaminase [Balneola sp.]MBF65751.1 glucosamine-6-phosphate deaminase [Balneola sp.]|tara:strand:+ start:7096 stop:9027 length:1932 start_codon:yes stop_codon:yes gene_type:complete
MSQFSTNPESQKFEKIPTSIFSDAKDASIHVAHQIADLIKEKAKNNEQAVIGLATGSTPTQIYDELVRLHREEGLSFQNVTTFNLDEYFPMDPDSIHSYVYFMKEYLFDHIDIKPENVHIPDGTLSRDEVYTFCQEYEKKIDEAGGLDIQILGIGRTGHVGFNEPGSGITSKTRLIALDSLTILDAASGFFGVENVPKRAITMGVGTIMKAKKIFLMAWGEGKASIIEKTVEGEQTPHIPATFLQQHSNVEIILDEASSAELTRVKTPWLVGPIEWDDVTLRKAVVWLSLYLEKPILKLREEDYSEHGMNDILTTIGRAYHINIRIFNEVQHTITGWPGGKPNADDTHRPERKSPFPKRVLIFSPHPDDDIISMGGTFIRLADQGHEVHVAYQTSGNIAVFDEEALRFADFVMDYHQSFGSGSNEINNLYEEVKSSIANKQPGQVDSDRVKAIKGMIRRGEAKATARYVGLPDENIHFLDLPFYETGKVRKNPIGPEDIKITKDLISKIKPHQIYAAGDLSDPHGTHRVCLNAIFDSLRELKNESWMKDCWVWLYRGAWQEWGIEEIEMAVPLSPEETDRKRTGIFKHQSQKDRPLFPGTDKREFWQRADDRTRTTAKLYDKLGLAEYEAMEAFVRWKELDNA